MAQGPVRLHHRRRQFRTPVAISVSSSRGSLRRFGWPWSRFQRGGRGLASGYKVDGMGDAGFQEEGDRKMP